mmetsp:Transcript_51480/g.99495  ORF Transcript_51480/g.99495 Transcript_51480/m.99495 type:complete len:98 (-) Transcript_51480:28-321(-)
MQPQINGKISILRPIIDSDKLVHASASLAEGQKGMDSGRLVHEDVLLGKGVHLAKDLRVDGHRMLMEECTNTNSCSEAPKREEDCHAADRKQDNSRQ